MFLNHGSHSRLPSISEESDSPVFEEQPFGPVPVIVPVPATPVPVVDDQGPTAKRSTVEDREIMRLQKEVRKNAQPFNR